MEKTKYSSAYLKYQLLKGVWLIDYASIQGLLPTVYDFIENKSTLEKAFGISEIAKPFLVSIDDIIMQGGQSFASKKEIMVIPIEDSLMKYDYCGAPGMQTISNQIKEADSDPNISGILLNIDSPGGTVDGTQELGQAVKDCSKPIIAFADGLMASAAYWIGSSADKVIAKDTTTEVGSIGVVLSFRDNAKQLEEKGIVIHNIFADQSDEKWKEILDAEKGDYKTVKKWTLNPLAEMFQNTVKNNRPNVNDRALKGRVFLAEDAKNMNLIDDIGNFDFAIRELNKLIIENKNSITMADNNDTKKTEEKKTLLEQLRGMLPKTEIKDISEDTKAEYETKLSDSATKLSESESAKVELQNKVSEFETKEKALNDKIEALEAKAAEDKTQIESLESNLAKEKASKTRIENDDDSLTMGEPSKYEKSLIKDFENLGADIK